MTIDMRKYLLAVTMLQLCACPLLGCAGAVVDTATDAAIWVVKVPVKIGGTVVDVLSEDDDD